MTYIFALLAAVIADFMTQEKKRESYSKDMSVFIIALVVSIICITVLSLKLTGLWQWIIFIPLLLLWWLWWILLEFEKFDISPVEIERSTIGLSKEEPGSGKKSLAALKNLRELNDDCFYK